MASTCSTASRCSCGTSSVLHFKIDLEPLLPCVLGCAPTASAGCAAGGPSDMGLGGYKCHSCFQRSSYRLRTASMLGNGTHSRSAGIVELGCRGPRFTVLSKFGMLATYR